MTKLSDLGPPTIGKWHDGQSEKDHFYTCSSCGQEVDMRDLRQVLWHGVTTDHKPLELHQAEIIEFPKGQRPDPV